MSRHRRRSNIGSLPRWQSHFVRSTMLLVLASGLLWLAFHYGLQTQGPYGPRPHMLETVWLQLHGAAALLALLAVGSLLPLHFKLGWKQHRNQVSGVLLIVALAALTLTGYLLYYFVTETSRSWISGLHIGVGVGMVPALLWHWRTARRLPQATTSTPESFNAPNTSPHR